MEDFALPALGHLSFLITFLAYQQRDVIRLRLIAILSLGIGLGYNSLIQSRMPDDQNIYPVLFWMVVFLLQNLALVVRAIADQMETPLRPASRVLMVKTFPSMHSKDWSRLLATGAEEVHPKGTELLAADAATDSLHILASGSIVQTRCGSPDMVKHTGSMLGERTSFLGEDEFNSSPCAILALTNVRVIRIKYENLHKLCKADRMRVALFEGLLRSFSLQQNASILEQPHEKTAHTTADFTMPVAIKAVA